MRLWLAFLVPFLILSASASAAPQKNSAPASGGPFAVTGVRFGGSGDKTRIVIDCSAAPDFRAFLLEDPWRLAVDIPSAQWRAPKNRHTGDPTVRGYRSGALDKDGLTRIIFDLGRPAIVASAFILPRDAMSKDRIVIDLKPATANLFRARTEEVWGNKALKGGKATVPRSETAARNNREMAKVVPPPERTAQGKKAARAETPSRSRLHTVVVDAGHGGADAGATVAGVKEKHVTLAVAKELQRQLEETGRYRVVLTRGRDTYIKLRERLALSRRAGADLFISVHADKIGRKGVRGASIYTLSENASDAETARLAEEENNAGVVAGVDLREESQDVADILLDLAMREKMNESNLLAQVLEQALRRKNVRLLPNSHRSAGFAVLKAPDVPAVLIETGFLSNPEEAKLLSSKSFQEKIASAMLDGIDAYFRKMKALQQDQ